MINAIPTKDAHVINTNQLCIGLYIHLDLGWMDHPFALSNFKIQDQDQIDKIKTLGLKKLRFDPSRSDCDPLVPSSLQESKVIEKVVDKNPSIERNFKVERLIQLHRAMDENEKKFMVASHIARTVTRDILSDPKKSIEQANGIVSDIMEVALTEGDIAIHAVNGNRSGDQHYQHSMNVLVLSMMMAKTLDISKEDTHTVGIAALFHDIGKAKISDKVLLKKEPLTRTEQNHYEEHASIGAQLAMEVGLSKHVAKIILQHHELMDGSGYPKHLKGDQIDRLSRLVSLMNAYDNLCNPHQVQLSKTPYEALAYLFANQRTQYDEHILKNMIRTLGIYPPGSIVQLSSGVYAIVISGNTSQPLRPFVMLHDPSTQRQAPVILDLREEPSIHISICLRPNQLPAPVLEYLNPRKRISFFLDAEILNTQSVYIGNSPIVHGHAIASKS